MLMDVLAENLGLLEEDAGAAAPPPWTPASLSGLLLWLDAGMGLLTEAGGPVADGGDIKTWQDQSGGGHHAVAQVAYPKYDADGMGGLPAVYQAQSDYTANMTVSTLRSGTQPCTAVYVCKMGKYPPTEASYTGPPIGNWYSVNTGCHVSWVDGVTYDAFGLSAGRYSGAWLTSPTNPMVISQSIGTKWRYFQNGTQKHTVNTPSIGWRVGGWLIGASSAYGTPYRFYGWISEIVVYDSELADADRQLVEGYLKTKYGIS